MPVKIGNVDIEWFNRLVLEGLYLEDQDGKVMFEANHVAAGFEIMPLLEGKFVFTTVRLFGFSFNLRKHTPQSPLNLQFVIDAFASKDSIKKEKNIDLRFNSIMIRRGNFSYNVDSEKETPGKFNAKHIDIKNLSAKISLKAFNKDSVNAHIKKMSFDEASGFSLNKLSLNVVGNRDSAFVQDFEVRLPQTDLKIGRARIDLSEIDSLPALLNNAPIDLNITPSQICLKDLSPFVPAFKNFADTIELSAEANGYINNFNLKRLTLKYSDKMLFIGQMELKNITHPEETYLLGKVNKMYITTDGISSLANNFNERPKSLPAPVVKLGTINFTGEISGFFDNLVAFGKLSSSIGSIQTDLIFGSNKDKNIAAYLRGRIASSNLRLHELFGENNPFGEARFDINIDTRRPVGGNFSGNIQAQVKEFDYKAYKYKDINLSGNFKKSSFDGTIHVNDPNGELYAQGIFQHQGQNSLFNFTARLDHFRPDRLNLTDKYEAPNISLALNADFTGDNIDNLEGSITLDSLSFETTPSSFFLKKFEVVASGHSLDRQLTITSDILNGEVTGSYSFNTLIPSLMNTFKGYVPALINTTQKKQIVKENNFALLLTIENTEALSTTLKLPFTMVQPGRITGHYNNIYNKFRIEAWLPKFNLGKSMFESGYLVCDNPNDKVNLQLKTINYNDKGLRNYLDLKADAKDNLVNTMIGWANNKERLFKADISASTLFVEEESEKGPAKLRTEVTLNKSPLIIKDTLWTINPANITIREGKIGIEHFRVDHETQYLSMEGTISKDPADTLLVDLKQIELSYVFDVLNIPVLQFGGEATGKFYVNDLFNSRMLNTDLEVKNFSFNQTPLGRLNLFSEWDDAQKGILMLGSINKDVFIPGIMEHVERTGIHSGDSISVYPTFSVSQKAKDKIIDYTVKLGLRIGIVGLYNIQFILDENDEVYVIEVNPRSSRTVPFLSKSTGVPMAHIATQVILGKTLRELGITEVYGKEKKRWYVKAPAFSFAKIRGMDSYLSPEMKSTGEAIGYDDKLTRALYKALQATGMNVSNYGTIFVTIADHDKEQALPLVRRFYDLGFNIEATTGTAEFLRNHGIRTRTRRKLSEGSSEIIDSLRQGHVSYVINTIDINQHNTRLDGYEIRRTAVENNVTVFTALETVKVLLDVLEEITFGVSTIDAK